jgi:hypothetical protein
MKKLTILLIVSFGALILSSCKLRETNPRINSKMGTFSITSPKTDLGFTLTKSHAEDTLLVFKWQKPDYGLSVVPKYTVYMDTSKTGTAHDIMLGSTNKTSLAITVGDLNSKLLGANMAGGQIKAFKIRVAAVLGDSLDKIMSKPITLYFQPYAICAFCPAIYVPGNYQAESGYGGNWSPPDAPPLHTTNGKDVYDGYVYMGGHGPNAPNIQFKFTPQRNWDASFGAGASANTLSSNGDNISGVGPGYYKIDVNLNKLTYKFTKTNWALLGDAANGWNDDIAMTYKPNAKVWVKTLNLKQGEIKFRANGSWDINFGYAGNGNELQFNSPTNITVSSAGKYKVVLNLSAYPRTYKLEKVE